MRSLPLVRGRGGFTLLEVMVAIAIASFTVAALYGLFSMQSRQLLRQDLEMEMNQNLRFAADMIGRSVRLAGYGNGGYVYGALGPTLGADNNPLPTIIPFDDPGGDGGPDALTVVYMDPSLMMDTHNGVIANYDTASITFRPGFRGNSNKISQLETGDLLLCSDYADIRGIRSFLWTITGVNPTSGVVSVAPNDVYSDYAGLFSTLTNLTPVMTCSRGEVVTFYVDDDDDGVGAGSSAHPVLMMSADQSWPSNDDVPLVDNIEDLQLEYCLDDGTFSADCTNSAAWVSGGAIDATSQADNIWMVRVLLLGRSSRSDFRDAYPGQRIALGNRLAAATGDNFYRRVLSTEVALRNVRYLAVP